jgi:divalent metal cation (Fe/Co/Zn/Cd) transporter
MVSAYEKFISRDTANFGTFAIAVTILSIISKELLASMDFGQPGKPGHPP